MFVLLGERLQRVEDRDAGRRNAASWREKFIRSAGLIFFVVISIWLKLLRSFTSTTWRARARAGRCGPVPRWRASSTPLTLRRSGSMATYLNFGISVLPRLGDVDAAQDLGDGRDVFFDQPQCLVAQGAHALVDARSCRSSSCDAVHDQRFDRRRDCSSS